MEKTFSKIEINTIKSIAKNMATYVAKREKIEKQIKEVEEKVAELIRKRVSDKVEKLTAEKRSYDEIIESMNTPVRKITGGYTVEEVIDCVKEGTGKMDDKGKEIMQTRYVLKYPETVIPVTEASITSSEAATEAPAESDDPNEMPEELLEQDTEAAESDDPFAGIDPFNED